MNRRKNSRICNTVLFILTNDPRRAHKRGSCNMLLDVKSPAHCTCTVLLIWGVQAKWSNVRGHFIHFMEDILVKYILKTTPGRLELFVQYSIFRVYFMVCSIYSIVKGNNTEQGQNTQTQNYCGHNKMRKVPTDLLKVNILPILGSIDVEGSIESCW